MTCRFPDSAAFQRRAYVAESDSVSDLRSTGHGPAAGADRGRDVESGGLYVLGADAHRISRRDRQRAAGAGQSFWPISGVEFLQDFLARQIDDLQLQNGGRYNNPGYFQGMLVARRRACRATAAGFRSVVPNIENGELAGVRYGVEDESARAQHEHHPFGRPGAARRRPARS